jgi:hypothetical protein
VGTRTARSLQTDSACAQAALETERTARVEAERGRDAALQRADELESLLVEVRRGARTLCYVRRGCAHARRRRVRAVPTHVQLLSRIRRKNKNAHRRRAFS